jgi:predicted transposase YdaD
LLVRYTFENPERAAAELRVALLPFVVAQVDWNSLKAERNSVVDPELRETETELLFSARLKDGRQVLFFSYLLRVVAKEDKAGTVGMLKSLVGMQRAEELMGTWAEEYFQKGLDEGLAKGRAEGRAEAVLALLSVRGVRVDREARQRILSCTDLATLSRWLERAARATHISEVLEDLAQ